MPKILISVKDRTNGLIATCRPIYRGILGVSRIFADPSRLNHKVKSLVKSIKGYVGIIRHGSRLSVKHTESGKSNEKPIGPNTQLLYMTYIV